MSKITKKIKSRRDEKRKKTSPTHDEIKKVEVVTENVKTDEKSNAELLKKAFAGIKTTLQQSSRGYGKTSTTPIAVSPTITPASTLPEAPIVEHVKQSKAKTFIKNAASIVKGQIGGSGVGQSIDMVKDFSKQFKDMFKTQEELIGEQAIEEEKRRRKVATNKEKEDKIKETALRKAGLFVEKKSISKDTDNDKESLLINKEVAEDVKKIRSILEAQSQNSAHSMEVANEQAEQQVEIVKTLQGIEKNLETPSITKELTPSDSKEKSKGFLDTLKDGFFSVASDALSMAIGGKVAKLAGKIPGVGKLLTGAGSLLGIGAKTAPEVLTTAPRVSAAAVNAAQAEANVAAKAAATGAKATGGVMKVAGGAMKAASKALGPAGAIIDVGMGINSLVEGDRQKDAPSGLAALSPMNWGMFVGEQLNQAIEKVSDGQSLGTLLHSAFNDQKQTESGKSLYEQQLAKAKASVVPDESPVNATTELTGQMTDALNEVKEAKAKEQPPIIIQQTATQPQQSTGNNITVFGATHNTNSTWQRMMEKSSMGGFFS